MRIVTDNPRCNYCAARAPTVDIDYEFAYAQICEPCLQKALALFGWKSSADTARIHTRVMDDGVQTKDGAA